MSARLLPLLLLLFAGATLADEGMWTFDNAPLQTIESRHGVRLSQDWLDHLRLATVRLEGGCTASVASASGLLLTNHHCIRECLRSLSTPERDIQATGFLAAEAAAEERCASAQASILEHMEDISAEVRKAVGDASDTASHTRRKAVLTRLEEACEQEWQRRGEPHACEAVSLYGGGQYFLYHYRRYEDLRLVFAPEADVGFFGGDADNFRFPRWSLDFALLRLWSDGRPARTPDYLHWREEGAAAGEAVFVAGHPGSTQRQKTVAQLRFERELPLSQWLLRAAELRGRYLQFAADGGERARVTEVPLFALENAFKVRRQQMAALLAPGFLEARLQEERALRQAVAEDQELQAFAGAWQTIEEALERYRGFHGHHLFLERGAALQGELAWTARMLVRAAGERTRPSEERQRGFSDAALPLLRQELLAPRPVDAELETLRLGFSLEKMEEYLGVDDPVVRKLLGEQRPAEVAARLIGDTRLGDPAFREALWEGGLEAVRGTKDPLMVLALAMEPAAIALRERHEQEVEAPLRAAEEQIALARFAVHGTAIYPDATFTLRLSHGVVQGWQEAGDEITPFTVLDGLYERTTGKPPFRLPSRWLQLRDTLDPQTPFNFASSNDIVGGNSGSPLVDAQGRLVGLAFDGNMHSIGGDYGYDAALNRAISVHPAIIVRALQKIYGAERLVRELTIE